MTSSIFKELPVRVNIEGKKAIKICGSGSVWSSNYAHLYGTVEADIVDIHVSFQDIESSSYAKAYGITTGLIKLYYDADGVYAYNDHVRNNNTCLYLVGYGGFKKVDTPTIDKWKPLAITNM